MKYQMILEIDFFQEIREIEIVNQKDEKVQRNEVVEIVVEEIRETLEEIVIPEEIRETLEERIIPDLHSNQFCQYLSHFRNSIIPYH